MIYKCKNCGGNVVYDPEKQEMFCPFCESEKSEERTNESGDIKVCPNCGGEIPILEHTSALQCPYCDHYVILNVRIEGEFTPNKIIPFKYGKEKVKNLIKEKFKKNIFAPTDFLSEARLNSMTGEYVPFWMFDYDANCIYQGEGTKVRRWVANDIEYKETSYFDIRRDMDIEFRGIPADASNKMPDNIMDLMEPYQYGELVDFKPEYMSGFEGEKYNLSSGELEFRAKLKMEDSANQLINNSISGYQTVRQMNKNICVNNNEAKYSLLPVWKYIYSYADKQYPFYVNGQTGKIVGKTPVSKHKVMAYGLTIWGVLTAMLFMIYSWMIFLG